jgi:glucosamine-6-phosphate deaminase
VNVTVFRHERDAAAALADQLVAAVSRQPTLVLGLPTGRTPVALYRRVVDLHRQRRVDLSRITTFNLDEFLGLPSSHPGSYRAYMTRHLFAPVGLTPPQVHFLDGTAPDPEVECARFERAIVEAGGVDVMVLGIGANGHVGFNEPAAGLSARSHRVRLRPETRRANAAFFGGDPEQVPAEALSMGMATILQSRRIVLLAMGRGKGRAVERMANGPVTTRLPASFLQLHHDVEILVDEAAAERLTRSQS